MNEDGFYLMEVLDYYIKGARFMARHPSLFTEKELDAVRGPIGRSKLKVLDKALKRVEFNTHTETEEVEEYETPDEIEWIEIEEPSQVPAREPVPVIRRRTNV